MAISKKERAEFDAALLEARTLAALRWTCPVKPDVPPPRTIQGYSEGWDFNVHSERVWIGWSTCVSHGNTPAPKDGERHYNGSQNSRAMYSTKALALAALRYEVENLAANRLRDVDDQIRAEKANPASAARTSETDHSAPRQSALAPSGPAAP